MLHDDLRPIPGCDGYFASATGNIWSCCRNAGGVALLHKLKAIPRGRGYLCVDIRQNGERKLAAVHTLVCETFHGPRPDGCDVAHGDGNPSNNAAANLRWATPKENAADRDRHGRTPRGERHANAGLRDAQVRRLRQLRAEGWSFSRLSREFGVSLSTAHRLAKRLSRRDA